MAFPHNQCFCNSYENVNIYIYIFISKAIKLLSNDYNCFGVFTHFIRSETKRSIVNYLTEIHVNIPTFHLRNNICQKVRPAQNK